MLRKILVPVRGDGKGERVLAHATALADRFGAHIEVVHCRPKPSDMIPFGVVVPSFLREQIMEQTSSVADSEEQSLRDAFDRYVKAHDLKVVDTQNGEGASISWSEEEGKQIDVIKSHGRLSDMVVVAKPDRDRNLGFNTLKTALFGTARPVMMCPPGTDDPSSLCEHIAVAWNGSVEAVRAVSLTLDLLSKASQVTVLSTQAPGPHPTGADELAHYLGVRGIEANVARFKGSGNVGLELLKQTKAAGADTMVMGAYSDSHEYETMFGGNTQSVVDNADIPVVLVH